MKSTVLSSIQDIDVYELVDTGDINRAATLFVRKYQKYVYSIALRYLKNEFDAEDASQETFIRALRYIKTFRRDSSLSTWLYTITTSVCSTINRKRKIQRFFGMDTEASLDDLMVDDVTAETSVQNEDFEREFRIILQKLPVKQRETFALRYFDDLSYEEISKILGTSVGGLKANYFQAVKKLAVLLKDSELLSHYFSKNND
jgi:RNA polymerase sigma-70 factor (ECF subfamily)